MNFNNLSLICSAPGTPENPTTGLNVWGKGIPAPPWSYEYAYPADCLRPIYVVPQFTTGFTSGVPITTAVTGGAPAFWNGPPVRFKVAIDQIDSNTGKPGPKGADQRVILTNQEQAILAYIKRVANPDVWDDQFQQAIVVLLGARLAIPLTGDKGLAQLKPSEANQFITLARQSDGNEGLTVNDVTPDWIRTRGISYRLGVLTEHHVRLGPNVEYVLMPTAADAMYPGGPKQGLGNKTAQASEYPAFTQEQWEDWLKKPASPGLYGARKDGNLEEFMANKPEGFLVDPKHPDLGKIKNDVDIYTLPDRPNDLLAIPKPKQVPVA
jgi:hypothetical protein